VGARKRLLKALFRKLVQFKRAKNHPDDIDSLPDASRSGVEASNDSESQMTLKSVTIVSQPQISIRCCIHAGRSIVETSRCDLNGRKFEFEARRILWRFE
jgi:hypothetical protein